ncbi:biliverdin-producing heme oxygenase [Variovorax defluvii]|uniref:Biliverdin-producing heme oxygenase n=1 Tax=Variovorax defluvii TaxID=913761 RepID=A0ABP8HWZ9_9BURK
MLEEFARPPGAAPLKFDVLMSLRSATSALHTRLDARLPIARADASLHDYVAHLRVLRPWLLGLREALAGHGPALDAVARHVDAKLADLEQDLAQAGDAGPADVPVATGRRAGDSETPGFAWGLAYVVEGSQLGGAVLHRRLRERLAPHALRYLAGSEEKVAARWRDFVHRLRRTVVDESGLRQAQHGAVAGFEDLVRRFGL